MAVIIEPKIFTGKIQTAPSSSTDVCLAKEAVQLQSPFPLHTFSVFLYLSPSIPKISGVICLLLPLSHTPPFSSMCSVWQHLLGARRVICLQHTSQQSPALLMDPCLRTRCCMKTDVTAQTRRPASLWCFPSATFGCMAKGAEGERQQ